MALTVDTGPQDMAGTPPPGSSPATAPLNVTAADPPSNPPGPFDALRSFLVRILPDAEQPISVRDSRGRVFETQPSLPMRREFALKEWFRNLPVADRSRIQDLFGASGDRGMGAALLDLPEAVVDALDVAFGICHGAEDDEVLARAREAAKKPEARPSDLFGALELFNGIAPFCVAPLIQMIDAADPILRWGADRRRSSTT